jgi:hypothetical protein
MANWRGSQPRSTRLATVEAASLSSKALPGMARQQCSGVSSNRRRSWHARAAGTGDGARRELGGSSRSASSGNSSSRCSRMRRRSSATICWRVRRVRSASPRSARRTEGDARRVRLEGRRSFAVVHGLYWLCANLASGPPLHIVVDDAHRADAPSLRYLAFLLPRLKELPVALAVATRPTYRPAVGGCSKRSPATRRPRSSGPPLSRAGVRDFVEVALGAPPEPEFVNAW